MEQSRGIAPGVEQAEEYAPTASAERAAAADSGLGAFAAPPASQGPPPSSSKPKSVPPPLPPTVPPSSKPKSMPPPLPPMAPAAVPRDALPAASAQLAPRTPLGGFEPAPGSAPLPPVAVPGPFEPPAAHAEPIDYTPVDVPNPEAGTVLQHLARVGVYEPSGGAPPAWEMAAPQKSRGAWVFIVATVLVLGSGGGAYAYAHHVRVQKMALAKSMTDQVDKMLDDGSIADLKATDDKLSRVFDLDSRSQRAAHSGSKIAFSVP